MFCSCVDEEAVVFSRAGPEDDPRLPFVFHRTGADPRLPFGFVPWEKKKCGCISFTLMFPNLVVKPGQINTLLLLYLKWRSWIWYQWLPQILPLYMGFVTNKWFLLLITWDSRYKSKSCPTYNISSHLKNNPFSFFFKCSIDIHFPLSPPTLLSGKKPYLQAQVQ